MIRTHNASHSSWVSWSSIKLSFPALDQISTGKQRNEITTETMEKALMLADFFRIESTEIYKDTFREGILERETEGFQRY